MHEFKLPEIGEGVVEGEIVQWLKQPGDAVAANEPLVEVMTDKATVEIPSPAAGVVTEHKAAEGDICAVGALIALIDTSGAASPKTAATPAGPAQTAPVQDTPAPAPAAPAAAKPQPARAPVPAAGGPVLATPAARALAREEGIDLSALPPNGRGRITKKDVLEAGSTAVAPTASPTPRATGTPTPIAPAVPATPTAAPAPAVRRGGEVAREDEYIPFRGMRRVIAEGLVRSYSTAVHYTYVEQIDVTKLVALRTDAKAAAKEQGVSLSYLPFIVKAVLHALRKYPIVNATLDEEQKRIVLRKRYHIGVAAATEQGLMVPVIHDADQLSLLDIAREIKRLGEGAKSGRLARDELTGSTFSITSLGTIGGVLATPIINYPEVGILGVHAIRKTPIVNERDEIVIGHLMNLSVSFDHRVVDGYEGASFLQEVKRFLEDPNLLLLAGI